MDIDFDELERLEARRDSELRARAQHGPSLAGGGAGEGWGRGASAGDARAPGPRGDAQPLRSSVDLPRRRAEAEEALEAGQNGRAAALFAEAVPLASADSALALLAGQADALFRLGRAADSERAAARAVQLRPTYAGGRAKVARARYWQGRLADAVDAAAEGLVRLGTPARDVDEDARKHAHLATPKGVLAAVHARATTAVARGGDSAQARGTGAYKAGDALVGALLTTGALRGAAPTADEEGTLRSNRCAMLCHVAEACTPATYAASLTIRPQYTADELAGALVCVYALVSGSAECEAPPDRSTWLRLALVDARKCHALRPMWFRASLRVATCLAKLGRSDEAKRTLEEALRLDHEPAHRAELEVMAKKLNDSAASAFGMQAPEDGDWKKAADARFAAKDYPAAADLYRRALAERPRDAILHSNLSAALCGAGRYPEAATSARASIQCDPSWGKGYLRLGAALHFQREFESAYCVYMKGSDVAAKAGGAARAVAAKCQSAARSLLAQIPKEVSASVASWRDDWFRKDAHRDRRSVRIFVTSDLHVDQHGNISWCDRISDTAFRNDCLIVAGDVGDTMQAVRLCMERLARKFRRVFYCAGNHDLWIRPDTKDNGEYPDSICKLFSLQTVCEKAGSERGSATMMPMEVARGVFVVPLHSWYHYSFDTTHPKPGGLQYDKFCRWPFSPDDAASYLLGLNQWRVDAVEARVKELKAEGVGTLNTDKPTVITFSHFLPRTELPYPWGITEMAKAVGCVELDAIVQRLGADVHAYGHTHMNGDGPCGTSRTRYVQYALEGGGAQLYCVFDNGVVAGKESLRQVSHGEVLATLRNRGYPDPTLANRPAAETCNLLYDYLTASLGLHRPTASDDGSWRAGERFPNERDAMQAVEEFVNMGWSRDDIQQVLDVRPINSIELSLCLKRQLDGATAENALRICRDLLHAEARRRYRLPGNVATTQAHAPPMPNPPAPAVGHGAEDDLVDAVAYGQAEDDILEDAGE